MYFGMREQIMAWAEKACDTICDLRKYPESSGTRPRIVAHRGAWDAQARRENTLDAFHEAQRLGADGIEFDVHFTRDNVPVVHHDPGLGRLFNREDLIEQLSFEELRALVPAIPTLAEVLALKDLHFMIEIKTPLNFKQQGILHEHLAGRKVGDDFHMLVLNPALVRESAALPSQAWILVGELKLRSLVDISLSRKFGGVAGHYLGMTNGFIARLHDAGQVAGVGFTPTKNMFNREWRRGIDFVFTNSMARVL